MQDFTDLEIENLRLKRRLENAEIWIRREVENRRFLMKQEKAKHNKLIEKIEDFFGENGNFDLNDDILEELFSCEIYFSAMNENYLSDGIPVIIGYQKTIEKLIEKKLTKYFRKFIKENKKKIILEDKNLEKILYSIVNSGFLLGIGKLLPFLKESEKDGIIKDFFESENFLAKYFLQKEFLEILEKLSKLEVFATKRHLGKLNLEETIFARKLLIGEFEDKKSILGFLILI